MRFVYSAALGAIVVGAVQGSAAFAADVTPDDIYFGNGNANGSFTVATGTYGTGDNAPVLELGLRGKLRFNASGAPENTFHYDGTDTYTFQAGPATGGFGPTTPVWSFEWSVNTDRDYPDSTTRALSPLNALTYVLRVDGDPTAGTDFTDVFDPINVPFADHGVGTNSGEASGSEDVLAYSGLVGSNNVAQNSWNYEFFNELSDAPNPYLEQLAGFDPNVNGTYRIELVGLFDGQIVASTGININVVGGDDPSPIPLPAGLPLLAAALGGLAIWRRRSA